MSLLEHPDAQALLADAVVAPEQVRGCQDRITTFLQRYLPRFYRAEQRAHAALVIRGLLSGLQRKTCEPIAVEAGVSTASRSRTSSAPAGGTTRPSWPNSGATSARRSATPTRS